MAYERAKEEEALRGLLKEGEEEEEEEEEMGGGGGGEGKGEKKKKKKKKNEGWEPLPGDVGAGAGWRVPTVAEVGEELVERRKRRLLDTLG